MIIIIYIYLLDLICNLEKPGYSNDKYKINSYYGSFYLLTQLEKTYKNDEPVLVDWSDGFYNEENEIFIADYNDHTIKMINQQKVYILLGKINDKGYRNGYALNSLLYNPSAIVLYKPLNSSIVYSPFLLKENSIDCIFANLKNITNCLNKNYDINNINNKLVKLLQLNNTIKLNEKYLFISDTGNHCIRIFDFKRKELSTYAGQCGKSGFKDGMDSALFNNPKGLGIDANGILYVNDNNYIRMIDKDRNVSTLLNGSCFEYRLDETIYSKFKNKLLCFRKWIKNFGKPDDHIIGSNNTNICLGDVFECSAKSPLINNNLG